MSNNNKTCKVCQRSYRYCPNCYSDRHLETWHIMFHDENCKKIFKICLDDFLENVTREETINLLLDCDLTYLDEFEPNIKLQIENILDSDIQKTVEIAEELNIFDKYVEVDN